MTRKGGIKKAIVEKFISKFFKFISEIIIIFR